MKRNRILFLDESGKATFKHISPFYVLSACSIPVTNVNELRIDADKIIFKYWGTRKSYIRKYHKGRIIFHATDIFNCNGAFSILKEKGIAKDFWGDVYSQILSKPYISYYMSIVDKTEARKIPNWKDETTMRKSYQAILENYIKHIIALKTTGTIIAESSYDQDISLVQILSAYQRNKFKYKRKEYNVNEIITSLSLVNKHDDSIGSQVADLIAWTVKNKYLIDTNQKKLGDLRGEERKLLEMYTKRLTSRSTKDGFHSYTKFP